MEPFIRHTGLVAPLERANVDTDQIMPKQFLKRIERTGFGQFLFNDWRFLPDGSPNLDFTLNRPEFQGASILVAGKNFGNGSSREHAPWGLADYGFRAIIAPSFADIFYNNCFKNFLLPVALPAEEMAAIFSAVGRTPGYRLTVDLEQQTVSDNAGFTARFDVDPFRKHCLLNGLDDIGLTLQQADAIATYESRLPEYRR